MTSPTQQQQIAEILFEVFIGPDAPLGAIESKSVESMRASPMGGEFQRVIDRLANASTPQTPALDFPTWHRKHFTEMKEGRLVYTLPEPDARRVYEDVAGVTPQSPAPGLNLTGVMLRRQGGEDDPSAYAVVEVEIGGKWVEVIREMLCTNFSHIVNPSGIRECQERSKK